MMAQNVRLDEFYHIIFLKLYFGKKTADPHANQFLMMWGGSRPYVRITCFYPKMQFFFDNMVNLIQTNILSYHLLKSVNKRKNGELNLFFASLLCRKSPHPIFFLFKIKKNKKIEN